MENQSFLQSHRLSYRPQIPPLLRDLNCLSLVEEKGDPREDLKELFPNTYAFAPLSLKKGAQEKTPPLKIGVVLSGGQAPGGHNVICGLFDAMKQLNPSSELLGFIGGPSGILKNACFPLSADAIDSFRNSGGFDMIGAGRTKIETAEQFKAARATLEKHKLNGLVVIGGDDSNTNAALLAEYCLAHAVSTRIIGVPKTIDGDLKNAYIETSFGFDTASKTYGEIVGNVAKDALSAKKYTFFIKIMGRSASHLALECALQTHVNLTFIGEEVQEQKWTLGDITNQIADLVCARAAENKHYGVILIPEGLLEFIPECRLLIKELEQLSALPAENPIEEVKNRLSKEALACFLSFPELIQHQLLLDRDPHGNIPLSKIETERLLIALVERELKRRAKNGQDVGAFNPQPLFCGYEGRAALPSNFDCNYAYALGLNAALLVARGASGVMSAICGLDQKVERWIPRAVPIVQMLHLEMRKGALKPVIRKALVDLKGNPFARFEKERQDWKMKDCYLCPGPIQFEGPASIVDSITMTLKSELSQSAEG